MVGLPDVRHVAIRHKYFNEGKNYLLPFEDLDDTSDNFSPMDFSEHKDAFSRKKVSLPETREFKMLATLEAVVTNR